MICQGRKAHPELVQLGPVCDKQGTLRTFGSGTRCGLPKVIALALLPTPLKPSAFPCTDTPVDLLDNDVEEGAPFGRPVTGATFEDPRPMLDEISNEADPHYFRCAHGLPLVRHFERSSPRIENPFDELSDFVAHFGW